MGCKRCVDHFRLTSIHILNVRGTTFDLQVVVGAPPSVEMEDVLAATPFGIVMAGRETSDRKPSLSESEVKLAFNFGAWTSQVARMLHDAGDGPSSLHP